MAQTVPIDITCLVNRSWEVTLTGLTSQALVVKTIIAAFAFQSTKVVLATTLKLSIAGNTIGSMQIALAIWNSKIVRISLV